MVLPQPALFPVHLVGEWQRDWRLTGELVDIATLSFKTDGISLSGRRTNPLRGILWLGFRLGWTLFSLATFLSILLTCIGITWRACVTSAAAGGGCHGTWVWIGPLLAIPTLWITGWIARKIVRRYTEPFVSEVVPWSNVTSVATDGRAIDILIQGSKGTLRGHFRPKASNIRPLLDMIRQRQLPEYKGGESGNLFRPLWLDRAASFASVTGILFGATQLEPYITRAAILDTRPQDAIPTPLSASALEARTEYSCPGGTGTNGGVTAQRTGNGLSWSVTGQPAGQLALLRMRAGDSRFEVVDTVSAKSGTQNSFFVRRDDVGMVALMAPGTTARNLLNMGRIEDLSAASCSGLVQDLALAQPADSSGLEVAQEGMDLSIKRATLSEGGKFLVVRRRNSPRGELFRWCELNVQNEKPGFHQATAQGATFPGFFTGADQEALVYFVPDANWEEAQKIALGGSVQRCLIPESLWAGGLATLHTEVRADSQAALLKWRTGLRAHQSPMFLPNDAAAVMLDKIATRYREVWGELQPAPSESVFFNEAFFDTVPWSVLFTNLSFQKNLPEIEHFRSAIAQVGGDSAGEDAVLRLGEAFLQRFPAQQHRYDSRFTTGKAWVDAPQSLKLSKSAGEVYGLVGRFVLVDLGRHLEEDLNQGRLGFWESARFLPLMYRLESLGISIDEQQSSTSKAFYAWVTGDFSYLINRATKSLAQLAGQGSSQKSARYALKNSHSLGASVRMSDLSQDGSVIGWVAQFDASAVRVGWQIGQNEASDALLLMSAAYSDEGDKMAGLAVESGVVKNWLWKPSMGGLVTVSQEGTVALLDLRRGTKLGRQLLRPALSMVDLSHLVHGLQAEKASAFQTYMLVGGGKNLLSEETSSPQLRERRLLALAAYQGHPIVCVVDLPTGLVQQGFTLFQAAEIVIGVLQTPESQGGPGLSVLAVANLDTGAKDYMKAFDRKHSVVRRQTPDGVRPSNLLVIAPRG